MNTKQDKLLIRSIAHYHVTHIRQMRQEGKKALGPELDLMRLIAARHALRYNFSFPIPVPRIDR